MAQEDQITLSAALEHVRNRIRDTLGRQEAVIRNLTLKEWQTWSVAFSNQPPLQYIELMRCVLILLKFSATRRRDSMISSARGGRSPLTKTDAAAVVRASMCLLSSREFGTKLLSLDPRQFSMSEISELRHVNKVLKETRSFGRVVFDEDEDEDDGLLAGESGSSLDEMASNTDFSESSDESSVGAKFNVYDPAHVPYHVIREYLLALESLLDQNTLQLKMERRLTETRAVYQRQLELETIKANAMLTEVKERRDLVQGKLQTLDAQLALLDIQCAKVSDLGTDPSTARVVLKDALGFVDCEIQRLESIVPVITVDSCIAVTVLVRAGWLPEHWRQKLLIELQRETKITLKLKVTESPFVLGCLLDRVQVRQWTNFYSHSIPRDIPSINSMSLLFLSPRFTLIVDPEGLAEHSIAEVWGLHGDHFCIDALSFSFTLWDHRLQEKYKKNSSKKFKRHICLIVTDVQAGTSEDLLALLSCDLEEYDSSGASENVDASPSFGKGLIGRFGLWSSDSNPSQSITLPRVRVVLVSTKPPVIDQEGRGSPLPADCLNNVTVVHWSGLALHSFVVEPDPFELILQKSNVSEVMLESKMADLLCARLSPDHLQHLKTTNGRIISSSLDLQATENKLVATLRHWRQSCEEDATLSHSDSKDSAIMSAYCQPLDNVYIGFLCDDVCFDCLQKTFEYRSAVGRSIVSLLNSERDLLLYQKAVTEIFSMAVEYFKMSLIMIPESDVSPGAFSIATLCAELVKPLMDRPETHKLFSSVPMSLSGAQRVAAAVAKLKRFYREIRNRPNRYYKEDGLVSSVDLRAASAAAAAAASQDNPVPLSLAGIGAAKSSNRLLSQNSAKGAELVPSHHRRPPDRRLSNIGRRASSRGGHPVPQKFLGAFQNVVETMRRKAKQSRFKTVGVSSKDRGVGYGVLLYYMRPLKKLLFDEMIRYVMRKVSPRSEWLAKLSLLLVARSQSDALPVHELRALLQIMRSFYQVQEIYYLRTATFEKPSNTEYSVPVPTSAGAPKSSEPLEEEQSVEMENLVDDDGHVQEASEISSMVRGAGPLHGIYVHRHSTAWNLSRGLLERQGRTENENCALRWDMMFLDSEETGEFQKPYGFAPADKHQHQPGTLADSFLVEWLHYMGEKSAFIGDEMQRLASVAGSVRRMSSLFRSRTLSFSGAAVLAGGDPRAVKSAHAPGTIISPTEAPSPRTSVVPSRASSFHGLRVTNILTDKKLDMSSQLDSLSPVIKDVINSLPSYGESAEEDGFIARKLCDRRGANAEHGKFMNVLEKHVSFSATFGGLKSMLSAGLPKFALWIRIMNCLHSFCASPLTDFDLSFLLSQIKPPVVEMSEHCNLTHAPLFRQDSIDSEYHTHGSWYNGHDLTILQTLLLMATVCPENVGCAVDVLYMATCRFIQLGGTVVGFDDEEFENDSRYYENGYGSYEGDTAASRSDIIGMLTSQDSTVSNATVFGGADGVLRFDYNVIFEEESDLEEEEDGGDATDEVQGRTSPNKKRERDSVLLSNQTAVAPSDSSHQREIFAERINSMRRGSSQGHDFQLFSNNASFSFLNDWRALSCALIKRVKPNTPIYFPSKSRYFAYMRDYEHWEAGIVYLGELKPLVSKSLPTRTLLDSLSSQRSVLFLPSHQNRGSSTEPSTIINSMELSPLSFSSCLARAVMEEIGQRPAMLSIAAVNYSDASSVKRCIERVVRSLKLSSSQTSSLMRKQVILERVGLDSSIGKAILNQVLEEFGQDVATAVVTSFWQYNTCSGRGAPRLINKMNSLWIPRYNITDCILSPYPITVSRSIWGHDASLTECIAMIIEEMERCWLTVRMLRKRLSATGVAKSLQMRLARLTAVHEKTAVGAQIIAKLVIYMNARFRLSREGLAMWALCNWCPSQYQMTRLLLRCEEFYYVDWSRRMACYDDNSASTPGGPGRNRRKGSTTRGISFRGHIGNLPETELQQVLHHTKDKILMKMVYQCVESTYPLPTVSLKKVNSSPTASAATTQVQTNSSAASTPTHAKRNEIGEDHKPTVGDSSFYLKKGDRTPEGSSNNPEQSSPTQDIAHASNLLPSKPSMHRSPRAHSFRRHTHVSTHENDIGSVPRVEGQPVNAAFDVSASVSSQMNGAAIVAPAKPPPVVTPAPQAMSTSVEVSPANPTRSGVGAGAKTASRPPVVGRNTRMAAAMAKAAELEEDHEELTHLWGGRRTRDRLLSLTALLFSKILHDKKWEVAVGNLSAGAENGNAFLEKDNAGAGALDDEVWPPFKSERCDIKIGGLTADHIMSHIVKWIFEI